MYLENCLTSSYLSRTKKIFFTFSDPFFSNYYLAPSPNFGENNFVLRYIYINIYVKYLYVRLIPSKRTSSICLSLRIEKMLKYDKYFSTYLIHEQFSAN